MDGLMEKLRWLVCLCLVGHAWGQGTIVPLQQALGKLGNGMIPISAATITVCAANTSGVPCFPALANTLFTDVALTKPLANPFQADTNGNYQFSIAPGQYTVTVTASGFTGYSYQTHVPAGLGVALGRGQIIVGTASAGTVAQSKPTGTDIRDYGADCSDTLDSTTAINNAIAAVGNFGKITFPPNCKLKVSGTTAISLFKVQGLEMEMFGRQGNSCDQASSSGLDYQQPYQSGNKVFSIIDSQRLRFKNLVIYLNGNADTGILIDQDLNTPPITTDNIFDGTCIFNNTPNRNSAFNGILAGPTSLSNVENQRFRDTTVACSTSAPTSATSNGNAITMPGSSNGVNEQVDFLNAFNCSVSLSSGGGQETVFSHLLDSTGTTNTNVIMPSLNGSLIFSRFENSSIAVQQVGNTPFGPTLIMGNDFTNAPTVMDCNNNGCGQLTTVMNNEKDTTPANWFNNHSVRSNSGLFAVNNRNFSWVPTDWNQGAFVYPDYSIGLGEPLTTITTGFRLTPRYNDSDFGGINFGSPYIDLQAHSGNTPQVDDFFIEAMPAGGFAASANTTLVFGHSPTNGINSWFSFQGTMSGVPTNGISTPTAPVITNQCSGGTSTWTYETVAHDGTGHTAASPGGSTTTGCLNLANGINIIAIPSIAGCTFFDVYRTAVPGGGTPSTTGKIGSVPCYNTGILNVKPSMSASGLWLADTGLAGDSSSPPSTNTTGLWQFAVGIQANGTQATLAGTGACATRTTQLGGSWAGQVTCTGTTGASTLTITPGGTAPNGWSCFASDVTHTLAGSQSTTSATAPVMTFTSVTASDVLTFGCVAY